MKNSVIFVSYVGDKGVAFGVNTETGENVYIHPKFVNDFDMDVGDEFDTILIPNAPDMRERTPWQTMRIIGRVEDKVTEVEVEADKQSGPTAAQTDNKVYEQLKTFMFASKGTTLVDV